MAELPKYLFAESPDIPGAGLIIVTSEPCYLFKVFKFDKKDAFANFMVRADNAMQIPGYMIALQYYDTVGYKEETLHQEDLIDTLKGACEFYYNNRIQVKAGYYRRNQI